MERLRAIIGGKARSQFRRLDDIKTFADRNRMNIGGTEEVKMEKCGRNLYPKMDRVEIAYLVSK